MRGRFAVSGDVGRGSLLRLKGRLRWGAGELSVSASRQIFPGRKAIHAAGGTSHAAMQARSWQKRMFTTQKDGALMRSEDFPTASAALSSRCSGLGHQSHFIALSRDSYVRKIAGPYDRNLVVRSRYGSSCARERAFVSVTSSERVQAEASREGDSMDGGMTEPSRNVNVNEQSSGGAEEAFQGGSLPSEMEKVDRVGGGNGGRVGKDAAGSMETKVDPVWKPRLIGKNGSRIRRLQERTGGRLVFGKGANDGEVYVYGSAEQQRERTPRNLTCQKRQRATWLALQDEIKIERLRDSMESMRQIGRPREVLREWDAIRRACTQASSPLLMYDYHQALAACIQIFQVHRSMRIFMLMCVDTDVEPTHRTFGFLCRAAVMSGDIKPLLSKLELACDRCGVSAEHVLREIEMSFLELKFPRVKVAMQLLAALSEQGQTPSERLLRCIYQDHARRDDVFYAEHCIKALPMSGMKRKPLYDLLAEMCWRAKAMVLSARVQHSFCNSLSPSESSEVENQYLMEVLEVSKWWRRGDIVRKAWDIAHENRGTPNFDGYALYTKSLATCGYLHKSLYALDEMELQCHYEIPHSLAQYVANEAACGRTETELTVKTFMSRFAEQNKPMSNATLSVLVLMVGRAISLTQAFKIFEDLLPKLASKAPSRMVYNALLSLCALHRRLEAGRRTVDHMQQFGMAADADAQCYLLMAAVRAKDEDSVWQYAKLLQPQASLSPLGRKARDMVILYLRSCGKHDKADLVGEIFAGK